MKIEEYRLKGEEWARKDGEARALEEQKKIVFSEIVNHALENVGAIAKAEHLARTHERYRDVVERSVAARTEANIVKAQLNAMEMSFEFWRTREATNRAQMTLR